MSESTKRPNILIFMTDQQRGDSLINPLIPTPNLDKFRQDGLTFTDTYCPSPHCCPSRASFFTGLYPTRHGVWNNVDVSNALSRTTKENVGLFTDILGKEGYQMDYCGKWHVSSLYGPADRGWNVGTVKGNQAQFKSIKETLTLEEMEVEKHRNWKKYSQCKIDKEDDARNSGDIIRPGYTRYSHYGTNKNPFGDVDVTTEAVDIILNRKNSENSNPWIQYVGLLGPHDPYEVPQVYLDKIDQDLIELPLSFDDDMKDKPGFYRRIQDIYSRLPREEHKKALHQYYAFCSFVDAQFGRILDVIEKTGQTDNTIVLFVSDHGDYAGEHGLWTKGLAPFRGAYHIPAVMRWPNGIKNPGRQVDEMVSLVDFAPTFLEAVNSQEINPHGKIPTEEGTLRQISFAGQSLIPFLKEENVTWRKELYTQSNGNELYGIQRIVFDKKYKFVFNGFDYDELYDLQKDPHEMKNLIADGKNGSYETVVKEYYKKMWKFARENGDQYNNPYINTAYPTFGPGIVF
ncbi:MAG: sulfatase-like hydrolase/transferase [Spirochaetaceae bacterium]